MLGDWIRTASDSEELLPLCHTTKWRWAKKILRDGKLTTKFSTFPNSKAVGKVDHMCYLFYGMPFFIFETGNGRKVNIQKTLDFAVGFIFDPSLADMVERFYPFDTGAFLTDRFKDHLECREEKEYKVYEVAVTNGGELKKYVNRYFDINERYTRGFVKSSIVSPTSEEMELFNFLKRDGASEDDMRFRAVEIHSLVDIDLKKYLKYVLVPEVRNLKYPDDIDSIVTSKYPNAEIIPYKDSARTNSDSLRESMVDTMIEFYDKNPSMAYSTSNIKIHDLNV